MSSGIKKLALLMGSTLVALLAFESTFRVLVLLDNGGASFTALNDAASIPANGVVELGHIIRRSANERLVYELKPDLDVTFVGAPVRTNSLGLRSAERHPEKEAFTIVGIGDSIMFGQGVSDGEDYLSVLESVFAEFCPGPGVRTANLAVSGYNTVMEVESLRVKGLDLLPDLVVIEFVGNDLSMPNFVRVRRDPLDLTRSFALDYVRFRTDWSWDKTYWREMEIAGLERIPMEDPLAVGHVIDPRQIPEEFRDLVGWSSFKTALAELEQLGREHGFRTLMISLQPSSGELKSSALQYGRSLGFEVLDVGEELASRLKRMGEEDYVGSTFSLGSTDLHPSAAGHRYAAGVLFRYLTRPGSVGLSCREPPTSTQ